MHEFDALCLTPVENLSPKQIKQIGLCEKVSQRVFALYLNTSVLKIQQWERGNKHPHGISLKILNIVAHKGLDILA